MKTYFSLDENFEKIIRNTLKNNINNIKPISTGWTNIVFEVETDNGNYFFRFPRDDFWSRTIVKDYEFSQFIYGKTDFNTVKLNLYFDNSRPFSVHKKIEGAVLADKMNNLAQSDIANISSDIAKFMYQLHNVPFDKNKIFKTNNIGLNLVDFLDELLNYHVDPQDKKFWNYPILSKKPKNCLVHGDLNSSNVLLDENNKVTAIIDLGFAGFGNKYNDIARIIGRCPNSFKNEIINSYEMLSHNNLDYSELDTEIDIWKNIDNSYINYMRKIGIHN